MARIISGVLPPLNLSPAGGGGVSGGTSEAPSTLQAPMAARVSRSVNTLLLFPFLFWGGCTNERARAQNEDVFKKKNKKNTTKQAKGGKKIKFMRTTQTHTMGEEED